MSPDDALTRREVVKLAERAAYGGATLPDGSLDDELLTTLDTEIRRAAESTGRTIQDTADLLRMEAWVGDHYRGERFDRKGG